MGKYMKNDITILWSLENLGCANCAAKIERKVGELDGVVSASVDFVSKTLKFALEKDNKDNLIIEKIKDIVHSIEPDIRIVEPASSSGNRASMMQPAESSGEEGAMIRLVKRIAYPVGAILFAFALIFKRTDAVGIALYLTSYLIFGADILVKAVRKIGKGQIFDENFLMSIATIGAIAIGEYSEGVAVMIFYKIGEFFQDMAVDRSRKSIKSLMNIKPEYANLQIDGDISKVVPEDVHTGDFIVIKPGERIPLDGVVREGRSLLDTSAITGESMPRSVEPGSEVFSGSINRNGMFVVQVTKEYADSTVYKILDLVQNAASKKAATENFITKFARIYSPAVVFLALALAVLPPLIITGAVWSEWIGRALVFLVISCPCALVISIPLGFFGGIGGASKHGILFKGSNYLEALHSAGTIVFDKTGTLTKGVFELSEVMSKRNNREELLRYAAHAEAYSNHPIAEAIRKAYGKTIDIREVTESEEFAGEGTRVFFEGQEILAGNEGLMNKYGISYDVPDRTGTVVHVAAGREYSGYIVISDTVKEDSARAIADLRRLGIGKLIMLTGDNRETGDRIGRELGLDDVKSGLLPHQKVEAFESLIARSSPGRKIVFVGDGMNDAPVLSRADVGIAMGALGSDAAIEAADVVIMADEPSKVATALRISAYTRKIVTENIVFALGIKAIILILAVFGLANMWWAVFADVGVAILAILNAMRVLYKKFE